MSDNLNMMEISISQFINEIKLDLEDENYDPVIGIGKSGVGKTMSIHGLCQELGIGFCELRLVTLGEIDLLGIPEIENGRTTYASNELLPDAERDGESGILVLDEITSCTSTIRAAAYQLLDSKRALGNYKLPPKWKVVALGNGMSDGGVFTGMESAFLSRATCYRIEPNLTSWKEWAIPNGVNPAIIAYLTFDPSKLHQFNPDELASVFPCPRSWTALSKKLNKREQKAGGMLPLESVELYAAGTIGANDAPTFAGYYNYKSKTISPEDILSGKADGKAVANFEPEVVYLVIQQLIKQFNEEMKKGRKGKAEYEKGFLNRVGTMCNWIIDASEAKLDYAITAFGDITTGVKYFGELVLQCEEFDVVCPRFLEFAAANNLVFGGNEI